MRNRLGAVCCRGVLSADRLDAEVCAAMLSRLILTGMHWPWLFGPSCSVLRNTELEEKVCAGRGAASKPLVIGVADRSISEHGRF